MSDSNINDFGSKTPAKNNNKKECEPKSVEIDDCEEPQQTKKDSDKNKYKSIQWTLAGENIHIPCGETQKELSPDIYSVGFSNNIGVFFSRIDIKVDEIIEFKDAIYDTVLSEIDMFWDKANLFKEYVFYRTHYCPVIVEQCQLVIIPIFLGFVTYL